jgi:hypothetical protein
MAINPNIALGVQPIQQQPNMLAQYAQIMAIRAAQQETEGYEGVRNAITGGMDAGDPRMLQYGKRGIEAFRAAGEGRVKQQDALTKAYVNQRKSLDFVSTPDDLLAHGLSQFNDPVIAPQLKAQGLTPEKLTASFQRQLATEGFESLLKKRAMGLDDWYKDQTSRRNQDVSSGPGYQQAALAREKYKDQLAAGGDIVTTTVPDPENRGQRIEIQARRDLRTGQLIPLEVAPMPMRVDISPSSATSSFQPSGGGAPNVNALAPQGDAAPNVNALNPNAPQATSTFAMPKSTTPPVAVIGKDGNTVLMSSKEAVSTGATPATPATEARAAAIRKLPDAVAQSRDALNLIDKMVGKEDGSTKPAPGFKGAVGAGIGLRFIPGTSESDFQSMYDQISGGAFLQAFNTLKGGGAITEKEGEKATAAITRMKLSTSEKAFVEAAREFQDVLRRGIATAQKELSSGSGGAPADPLGIR